MRLSAGKNKNDRLTAYNGTSITYDEIGNPITIGGGTLEWEGRELKKYTPSFMDEYTYTYNADGIRTGKNLSGSVVQYVLDGSRIVSEQRDSRILIYLYDEAGSPIGIKYRAGNFAAGVYRYYFFEKNLQGDIIAIYTENGTKICTYTYDAWGNVITTLESGTAGHEVYVSNYNPFRYRGYYYDTETGWYYLQSRYYNPTWGRFLNADNIDTVISTPDQLTDKNLYSYCDNNPVVRKDDGGEFWDTVFDIISLGASVVDVISNPDDPIAWVGLALDIVCLATPGATGGGTIARAISKADDVVDAVRTADKVDDAVDVVKCVDDYVPPVGGGGISDAIKVGDTTVTFGHGGRHLSNTNLSTSQVNLAVANDVVGRELSIGSNVKKFTTNVNGTNIKYGAKRISHDWINVGTYYVQ